MMRPPSPCCQYGTRLELGAFQRLMGHRNPRPQFDIPLKAIAGGMGHA